MIIQHNIPALNSYNKLSTNNSMVQKNLEKLSSGYRINRAGDDAAGLAISEKMRAQITGLERAKLNAQDGISLVQTAEGALTEVHSMLNRLVELGTESANGIYQAEDREKIQSEVNQIIEEVDRISKATNFNGIKLLDGSLSATGGSSAVSGGQKVVTVQSDIASLKTGIQDQAAAAGVYKTDLKGSIATTTGLVTTNEVEFTVNYTDADGNAQQKVLRAKNTAASVTSDGALATAISTAIAADEDLKKLFNVAVDGTVTTQLNFTSTQAGTAGAKLDSISLGREYVITTGAVAGGATNFNSSKIDAAVSTPAADKTSKDVIVFTGVTSGTSVLNGGQTITIGDKTYEIVATNGDTMKVGKGNIAVNAGNDDVATLKNLVSALQSNGVKSATYDAAGDGSTNSIGIKIGDLEEVKAAETKANITSTSNGVKISDAAATKTEAKFTVSKAADGNNGKDAYLEINYIDEDGKDQTTKIKYTASETATTNAQNIVDAIAADEKLSKMFGAARSTDQVVLTSLTAGANGAKAIGVKTTDPASPSVDNFQTTTLGRDKGQTVSIDSAKLANGDTLTVNGKTFQFVEADKLDTVKDGNIGVLIDSSNNVNTAANLNLAFQQNGVNLEYNAGTNSFYVSSEASTETTGGLTLQIGDTADDYNKVTVSVDDMSAKGLGINDLQVTDQGLAADSIDKVKGAIEKVSVNRGRLGALQNRLEHTINNLATTTENMTAAESRIRDTDMAKEMMQFTKNNVLVQAAQAMLAQANQQPQQVLQLLR